MFVCPRGKLLGPDVFICIWRILCLFLCYFLCFFCRATAWTEMVHLNKTYIKCLRVIMTTIKYILFFLLPQRHVFNIFYINFSFKTISFHSFTRGLNFMMMFVLWNLCFRFILPLTTTQAKKICWIFLGKCFI